jgi:hypothetical protein
MYGRRLTKCAVEAHKVILQRIFSSVYNETWPSGGFMDEFLPPDDLWNM